MAEGTWISDLTKPVLPCAPFVVRPREEMEEVGVVKRQGGALGSPALVEALGSPALVGEVLLWRRTPGGADVALPPAR